MLSKGLTCFKPAFAKTDTAAWSAVDAAIAEALAIIERHPTTAYEIVGVGKHAMKIYTVTLADGHPMKVKNPLSV